MDFYDAAQLAKELRPYVQRALDDAQARHDSYGDDYMSESLWMVVQQAEALLVRIDGLLVEADIEVDACPRRDPL